MSRSATLLDLRTRVRSLANVQNDPNVTDTELNSLVNRHIPKVYDALIDAGPPDYYSATTTVTVSAGVPAYALPSNFRGLLGVYVQTNTAGGLRMLRAMPGASRADYTNPTAGAVVTVEFTPTPPILSADSDTFDGISGFEELVALMSARDVMVKRQDDPSVLMNSIEEEKNRILMRSRHRDRSGPKRTTHLGYRRPDRAGRDSFFGGAGGNLACYRLRGDTIEFYESSRCWP